MIPYGRQDISQEDIDAVVEVLHSDWVTQGPTVPRFESVVSTYCRAQYGVCVNSATSALHLACLALGLERGDSLWTSPNTFVASANCALYCGAQVDFVDIDKRTYNISVDALSEKLILAEKSGSLPKIVVVVHFSGQSCDMEAIHVLSQRYGFFVIEDASHAIGGSFRGEFIGNCRYSDITIFSFHPVKIVTTGEGGMAVTNSTELAESMRLLRSHGITRNTKDMVRTPDGAWYYEQIGLGFNYRMTDFQAALGVSQMTRLDGFISRRRKLASRYDELLSDTPLITPWQAEGVESAWHLYVVRIKLQEIGRSRQDVFDALRRDGIGVNVHYIPVHTQPYYRALGFKPGMYPEAENYYQEALSLPMFPGLSEKQQDSVVGAVKRHLT